MADEPLSPKDQLSRDGIARLAACRIWKSLWDLDLREGYFFAAPQRQRQIQSYSPAPQQRLLDAAELNTDMAFELCGDFATEVINTYMPEAQKWCELTKGPMVPQAAFDAVKDKVDEIVDNVFVAIRSSNLYSEISKAFDPDLSLGTVALWIEPPGGRIELPIVCSAIPIHEFEIDLGPYGEIDTRFAIRHTRNMYLEELLGADIWANVSKEIKDVVREKPAGRTELRWGFWRIWNRHDDECWQHVVYVKNDLVHDAVLVGEGSCPMIVFRWNPNPDWPWGHGPLLQGMPSLRQVDEYEIMRHEHAEMSIRPPIGFPDDSFAQIEQGLEPGMAYPIRVGSEGAMKRIYEPPPAEAANYAYEDKEHRLRKMFFVDFPQQTGDTPPTLGQWLDEMARAQRRIGRPGLPFFVEGPAKIFLRFKYIQQKRGKVQDIKADGRTIALSPYNPAQRAAEQQEIALAVQFLQLCGQFFPEEFKMAVDGQGTMKELMAKMRVKLVKFRPPEQVDAAIKQMSQLLGGQPPGGQVKGPPAQPPGAVAA
jgi:Bacteriophage head to tail connecting protein